MKPLDFHWAYAGAVSAMFIGVGVLGLPALLIAYIFLGVQFPPDVWAGLMFVVSLVLGFLLLFHLNFLLGSLAIVALDIRHISWAYFSVVRFLGGQIVPLWLFPPIIAVLAEVLPFKGTYYIPISIYIGKLTGMILQSRFQVCGCLVLLTA
jgi:ABC-2 type transport system permease protein